MELKIEKNPQNFIELVGVIDEVFEALPQYLRREFDFLEERATKKYNSLSSVPEDSEEAKKYKRLFGIDVQGIVENFNF